MKYYRDVFTYGFNTIIFIRSIQNFISVNFVSKIQLKLQYMKGLRYALRKAFDKQNIDQDPLLGVRVMMSSLTKEKEADGFIKVQHQNEANNRNSFFVFLLLLLILILKTNQKYKNFPKIEKGIWFKITRLLSS